MKLRAFPLLAWLLTAALLLGGCSLFSRNPPSVGAVTLTDKVDEKTMAPLNPTDTFTTGTQLIYATTLVQNAQKGTKVDAEWTFQKEGQGDYARVDASGVAFPQASRENYVAFSLKAVTTFMPGTYKVRILLDGQPAREATFKIIEKQ